MAEEPKKLSLTQPQRRAKTTSPGSYAQKSAISLPLSWVTNQPPRIPPRSWRARRPPTSGEALEEKIVAALQTVYDPEIPVNIHDLGLIYRLAIDPTNAVTVSNDAHRPRLPGRRATSSRK